jgi:hypothetical protein
MMNPLRSLLNLVRRKKQPVPPIVPGDTYCFHDEPFPEDDDILKVTIVKANDLGVKYRFVRGGNAVTMPKDRFLSIYRQANQ